MSDRLSTGAQTHDRQGRLFLFLYALAWAGGAVAYVPLLTLLLPVQVTALSDGEQVSWIATLAFAGAVSASISNIVFGWASDITGRRRPWIAAGLVLSCILLVNIGIATDLRTLTVAIVVWQAATNMMLAPLAAWAGDSVPDDQKGQLGGLLAIAPAAGALAGAIVTWPGLVATDYRPLFVAALVLLCVLPLLLLGRPRAFPQLMLAPQVETAPTPVLGMWGARFLVQVSEAALFAFLLVWLQTLSGGFRDNDAALLFGGVVVASIPIALLAGRWADKARRPILPLIVASIVAAAGLAIMSAAQGIVTAISGYALFGIAGGVFLALHSAQTLRFLPRPERRGRDLGVFNLTNTLPSLIMPGIAATLVPLFGFDSMFTALAILALCAACCLVVTMRWTQAS